VPHLKRINRKKTSQTALLNSPAAGNSQAMPREPRSFWNLGANTQMTRTLKTLRRGSPDLRGPRPLCVVCIASWCWLSGRNSASPSSASARSAVTVGFQCLRVGTEQCMGTVTRAAPYDPSRRGGVIMSDRADAACAISLERTVSDFRRAKPAA
jgi:hypothetical protein